MERVMNASETIKFRFVEDEPTPIVKDFNTFVNYIEDTDFAGIVGAVFQSSGGSSHAGLGEGWT